ncbi:hypothetical protein ACK3Z0_09145 [Aeromonas caviae]
MAYYHEDFNENESIRQGDIVKIGKDLSFGFSDVDKFGFVVTADCDIYQDKSGGDITILPIIDPQIFIDTIWIPETFSRERTEVLNLICEKINSSGAPRAFNCNEISSSDLEAWIKQSSITEILKALKINISGELEILAKRLFILSSPPSLKNHFEHRSNIQGRKEKSIKGELSTAFKKMRDDFYFIPEIKSSANLGAIIKLRHAKIVKLHSIYKNYREARINALNVERCIYRTGRCSDYLKYSIVQRFALLFSRIGMPLEFESDESSSIDIITDNLWEVYNEN